MEMIIKDQKKMLEVKIIPQQNFGKIIFLFITSPVFCGGVLFFLSVFGVADIKDINLCLLYELQIIFP